MKNKDRDIIIKLTREFRERNDEKSNYLTDLPKTVDQC